MNMYFIVFVFISCVYGLPKIEKKSFNELTVPSFPFYTRQDWGAVPPKDTSPLKTPVEYVVLHHTAIPGACNTTEQCSADMKSMQRYHNSLDWGDIGYNFCVGSEGGAYEGRGWHTKGIHAGRVNGVSIGICLIGDWREEVPPLQQLTTTKALIASGLAQGALSPDYKLVGHMQVMATLCPGGALMEEISKWDHYTPGPVDFGLNKAKP